MKRKLRTSTIYLLYGVGFVLLVTLSFTLEGLFSKKTLKEDTKHISDTSISRKKVTPVVQTESKLIRPYNSSDVKILLNYYDYKAEIISDQLFILNGSEIVSWGSYNSSKQILDMEVEWH